MGTTGFGVFFILFGILLYFDSVLLAFGNVSCPACVPPPPTYLRSLLPGRSAPSSFRSCPSRGQHHQAQVGEGAWRCTARCEGASQDLESRGKLWVRPCSYGDALATTEMSGHQDPPGLWSSDRDITCTSVTGKEGRGSHKVIVR